LKACVIHTTLRCSKNISSSIPTKGTADLKRI
jgi:hypothetical protein